MSSKKRTIIDQLIARSVRHNELLIPRSSVEGLFSKHCVLLGILNDNDEHPISIPGSATLLKYKNRFFLVCTRHQLSGFEIKNVCLMLPAGGQLNCITSAGAIWSPNEFNDSDISDIAVFDFTESCAALPELRSQFLDFREQHPTVLADMVVVFIAYGYPIDGREYAPTHIDSKKYHILCRYEGGSSDDAHHSITPIKPLEFEADGLSGGPAFCVLYDDAGFSIHLSGIIARGSKTRLMLIKSGAIQMMLEEFIRRRPA